MGDKKSFSLKYYLPLQENLERCDRRKRSFFLLLPYNPPISALEILFSLPPPSLSLGRLFFPPSSFVLPTLYQLSLRGIERFPPLPSGALSLSIFKDGGSGGRRCNTRPTDGGRTQPYTYFPNLYGSDDDDREEGPVDFRIIIVLSPFFFSPYMRTYVPTTNGK